MEAQQPHLLKLEYQGAEGGGEGEVSRAPRWHYHAILTNGDEYEVVTACLTGPERPECTVRVERADGRELVIGQPSFTTEADALAEAVRAMLESNSARSHFTHEQPESWWQLHDFFGKGEQH